MKIVLVHGIFNTARIFSFMNRYLEENGCTCLTPSIKPNNGTAAIEDLSANLRDQIDSQFGAESKFVLIGFSMGGIIARYYLQHLGGVKRVDTFISISAPHNGSLLACIHPGKGAQQLRPNSSLLKQLKQNESILSRINLYSFWTPFDLSIIPSRSSVWEIAKNKKFYSLMHPLMLYNKNVVRAIIDIALIQKHKLEKPAD